MSETETYEFFETKPVAREGRKGAGRKPDFNPFIEGVRAIAGQTSADGAPLARGADVRLDAERGETYKQRYSRVRRQLTAAGKIVGAERGTERIQVDMALKPKGRPESAHSLPDPNEPLTEYRLAFWDRYAGR
jgi:hypothetical protein